MPLKLTHAFSLEILALQSDITLNIQRKKVKLVIHCGSAPLFYTVVGYIFWNIKSCLRRKFGEQRHSYMCDVISMIHFYQSPKSRPMFKALVPGGNMCVCASMGVVGYGTISLMWHGGFILCKYLLLERRFRWISDKIAGMLFCKKREKTCFRQISPNSSHEINLGRVHEILTSNCMTHTIVANCIEKSHKIYFHIWLTRKLLKWVWCSFGRRKHGRHTWKVLDAWWWSRKTLAALGDCRKMWRS